MMDTRRDRRRTAVNPASPPTPTNIITQVEGSGTVRDTASSSAVGGSPDGPPTARNDKTSLVDVALKN